MSGVRRVREHLVERDRGYATSWAAAYVEHRVDEALACLDGNEPPRVRAALEDAAAVLAALGETGDTAAAALAAEDRAAGR